MKKYLFIAALASVALASCAKIEAESPVVNDVQNQISFQAVNHLAQTKAAGDTSAFTGSDFGTYAWFNGTDAYMTNQKITKQGETWKADGQTYYWPKSGSIDFISYAPHATSPWIAVTDSVLKATDKTVGTEDWLYADKASGKTYSNSGSGVTTIFHHALAQVCVKVTAKRDSNALGDVHWAIKVDSVSLSKIANKGSLTMALNSDKTHWTLPENSVWSVASAEYTNKIAGYNQNISSADTTTLITTQKVLPQTLSTDAQLTIGYTITTTLKSGITFSENIKKDVTLNTLGSPAIDKWQMNKNITYMLTIDPLSESGEEHEITFAPYVVNWVEDGATYNFQN